MAGNTEDKALHERMAKTNDALMFAHSTGSFDPCSLPDFCVIGNQSSGKSTLLQDLSGLEFPQHAGICTLHPIRVHLNRGTDVKIAASIEPSSDRNIQDAQSLKDWSAARDSLEDFQDVIMRAGERLGVTHDCKDFLKDTVVIKATDPEMPFITLVDLPGIVHSTGLKQTQGAHEVATEMIKQHLGRKNTVILAVVSLDNEITNQIVLTWVAEADPDGQRTILVLTKADACQDHIVETATDYINRQTQQTFKACFLVQRKDTTEFPVLTRKEQKKLDRQWLQNSSFHDVPVEFYGTTALLEYLEKDLYDRTLQGKAKMIKMANSKEEKLQRELQALSIQLGGIQNTEATLTAIAENMLEDAERDGEFGRAFDDAANTVKNALYNNGHFYHYHEATCLSPAETVRPIEDGSLPEPKPCATLLDQARHLTDNEASFEGAGQVSNAAVSQLLEQQQSPWAKLREAGANAIGDALQCLLDDALAQQPHGLDDDIMNVVSRHLREGCAADLLSRDLPCASKIRVSSRDKHKAIELAYDEAMRTWVQSAFRNGFSDATPSKAILPRKSMQELMRHQWDGNAAAALQTVALMQLRYRASLKLELIKWTPEVLLKSVLKYIGRKRWLQEAMEEIGEMGLIEVGASVEDQDRARQLESEIEQLKICQKMLMELPRA